MIQDLIYDERPHVERWFSVKLSSAARSVSSSCYKFAAVKSYTSRSFKKGRTRLTPRCIASPKKQLPLGLAID